MNKTAEHSIGPAIERTSIRGLGEVAGRILLAALFVITGVSKISEYADTQTYMASAGVPPALLPVVIATEVLGAVALILGWRTRVAALVLAGFSLLTAVVFHSNFAEQPQLILFLQNVSIGGGLLILVTRGPGPLSLDRSA